MKPRWLRAMIAIPSPARTPWFASARASAFERRCSAAKLIVPASSITIAWSGRAIAAAAIPAAGEAPQRPISRATRATLSGRIGRITPAWASVIRLKGTSGSDPSEPSLTLRASESGSRNSIGG